MTTKEAMASSDKGTPKHRSLRPSRRETAPADAGAGMRAIGQGKLGPTFRGIPLIPVAAVLLVIVIACNMIGACMSRDARQNAKAKLLSAEVSGGHVYDWSRLGTTGEVWSYADDSYEALWGIDVSSFQGDIDWAKVKQAGVRFVMIRVGYRGYGNGTLVEDTRFEEYAKGASDAGLDIGFYFFSQAVSEDEAREEAAFVTKRIGSYVTTYPVVFDMEDASDSGRIANVPADQRTSITAAFCDAISSAGYYPMVYGNAAWFEDKVDSSRLSGYPRWLADYGATPSATTGFQMLQYSEDASVAGVGTSVDLDLCFFRKTS